VSYRDVGVILNVVPKISPEGKVTMRVTPQVSSVSPTAQNLGNGLQSPVFNQQVVDTTIIAWDGETVAIGGLISRETTKNENKIPWFGDLPVVGAAFRYRTSTKRKQELLVILTPHVVRNRMDAERILAEEGRRMDWLLSDVVKTQGTSGMHPLFPTPPAAQPGAVDGALPVPVVPLPGSVPMGPPSTPLPVAPPPAGAGPSGDSLPPPRPVLPTPLPNPVNPGNTGGTAGSPTTAVPPPQERPLAGLSLLPGRGPGSSATPVGPVAGSAANPAVPVSAASPSATPNGTPGNASGTPGTMTPPDNAAGKNPSEQGKESDRWRWWRRSN
jgi:hypothetical protein